jgi:hypothetical protein
MSKVELTDKERILLWSIAAWFQPSTPPRLVTGTLMHKLFPNGGNEMYRFDKQIEDKIIEVAGFLARRRQAEVNDLVSSDSKPPQHSSNPPSLAHQKESE